MAVDVLELAEKRQVLPCDEAINGLAMLFHGSKKMDYHGVNYLGKL